MIQDDLPGNDPPRDPAGSGVGNEDGFRPPLPSKACLIVDWAPNRERYELVVEEVRKTGWMVIEVGPDDVPTLGTRPGLALVHDSDTRTRAWSEKVRPAVVLADPPLVVLHTWGRSDSSTFRDYAPGRPALLASSEAVIRNLPAILTALETTKWNLGLPEAKNLMDTPPARVDTIAALAILCQGYLATHPGGCDYLSGWDPQIGELIPGEAREKTDSAEYWKCIELDGPSLEQVIKTEAGVSSLPEDVVKLIRGLPLGKPGANSPLGVAFVGSGLKALAGLLSRGSKS